MYKILNILKKWSDNKFMQLMNDPNYKQCFTCKKILPLDKFGVNNKKYQRPQAKGMNHNCKKCNNER